MIKYIMEKSELNEILSLLHRLFNTIITLVDMDEYEISEFNVKGMSPYCAKLRKDRVFDNRCKNCDKRNLEKAKAKKAIHVYQCHNSLTEGIVPLYNKTGLYLGAIFFGQFITIDSGEKNISLNKTSKLYKQLPQYSKSKVQDLGKLLKYLGEYIIENKLLQYKNRPMGEKLKMYIDAHLTERITLKDLGKQIDRSSSFLTDYFKKEFGMSAKQYILKKKMELAKKMIESGEQVYIVASDLNFYDEFHFSKRFKAYWGKSPKHFKTE